MHMSSIKLLDYQFVIAGAPSLGEDYFNQFIKDSQVKLISNRTYDLLEHSKAALVTSGTATLETALVRIPEVVCYKANFISYNIGKRLVKIDYISLVNLIMDREVVTELIQDKFNPKDIEIELNKILGGEGREKMLQDFDLLIEKLGGVGASEKTANLIVDYLNEEV